MSLKWTDVLDIAIELAEAKSDVDPRYLNFVDLRNWVMALPDFDDSPDRCGEKILPAALETSNFGYNFWLIANTVVRFTRTAISHVVMLCSSNGTAQPGKLLVPTNAAAWMIVSTLLQLATQFATFTAASAS